MIKIQFFIFEYDYVYILKSIPYCMIQFNFLNNGNEIHKLVTYKILQYSILFAKDKFGKE